MRAAVGEDGRVVDVADPLRALRVEAEPGVNSTPAELTSRIAIASDGSRESKRRSAVVPPAGRT